MRSLTLVAALFLAPVPVSSIPWCPLENPICEQQVAVASVSTLPQDKVTRPPKCSAPPNPNCVTQTAQTPV